MKSGDMRQAHMGNPNNIKILRMNVYIHVCVWIWNEGDQEQMMVEKVMFNKFYRLFGALLFFDMKKWVVTVVVLTKKVIGSNDGCFVLTISQHTLTLAHMFFL